MKRINSIFSILMASLLSILGFNTCVSKKAYNELQQKHNELQQRHDELDQKYSNSVKEGAEKDKVISTQKKRIEYLEKYGRAETIYGGPNMMDRRTKGNEQK
jgi:hypothetical protein